MKDATARPADRTRLAGEAQRLPLCFCGASLCALCVKLRRCQLVMCLDFDGTIAPIAEHPARVRAPVAAKRVLAQLAGDPTVTVALISGRALRDLRAACAIRGAYYAGNHGLELSGPGVRWVHPVARRLRPRLQRIARTLASAVRGLPGAWVEDKTLTCSVHWRGVAPARRRALRRIIARSLAPWQRQIRVTRGKCVWEIRPPVDWGKGAAIAWLVRWLPQPKNQRRPLLVVLGDDQTDEDAFRMANRRGGVSIRVGGRSRASAARHRLRSPRRVTEWLKTLHRLRCPRP